MVRCDQIGVGISKAEFTEYLNSVKGGQFFHVRGYVNEQGEKADHFLRFGVKYGQIKARDVALLRGVLAGDARTVSVTHGAWVPPEKLTGDAPHLFLTPGQVAAMGDDADVLVHAKVSFEAEVAGATVRVEREGTINPMDVETFSNRKGNKKDGYRQQATLSYELPSTHPLVVAAIGDVDLQGTLLQGLEAPRSGGAEYEKQGQSAYLLEKDGATKWYIRDVLRVCKVVRVPGDYPFSATIPLNGVKKAIQSQWLLTGKYREFILTDGQFESITIEGQAILVDGVTEQFFMALPEAVKEELSGVAV